MDKLTIIPTNESFKIIKRNNDISMELFSSGILNVTLKDSLEFNINDLILKIEFKNEVNDITKKDWNSKKLELLFPFPPEFGKRSFTSEMSFGTINNKKISYYLAWEFSNENKDIILVTYSFYKELKAEEC